MRPSPSGRPPATSHAAIEEAAFALFEEKGFDATTLDDIAQSVGVGRRTLFRYYPSKNDILWGQFDAGLAGFEDHLAAAPADADVGTAIRDAVVAFNSYPPQVQAAHRRRIRLLLETPALLGHSELRYTAWRDVIARFVAARLQVEVRSQVATVAGRVALALAISAYEVWLADESAVLTEVIGACFDESARLFAGLRV
ncbi:mycofactocin system transcriptional regulator [Kribbia dieselivorans]|uniref:mycofactocin system transcriptional regulator n=1 Tax=Kribbia dieselivorans TaxID=331526 RepID=UPI000838CBC2|nr:mycofactocin system transcriptional regulator [Kribbia dieselivorans]